MRITKAFRLLLCLGFLAPAALVNAQTGKKELVAESDVKPNFNMREADILYRKGQYYDALPYYKKAFAKEDNPFQRAEILFRVGECYRQINSPKDAMEWYFKAIREGFDRAIVLLYLADAQKSLGKYEDALANYKEYIRAVDDDPRGLNGIKSCELARQWVAKPSKHVLTNIKAINTKYMDFSLAFSKKNTRIMIFTSSREDAMGKVLDGWTGQKYSDLYQTTRDDRGKWTQPRPLPAPINSELTEGVECFDKTGNVMYFTKCLPASNVENGHCNIFTVRRKGVEGWSEPIPLKIVPDTVNIGHPALSPDEKSIYFAAELEGGYGGKDIYVSYRKDGKWMAPINLGSKINTPGDEVYPYFKSDGTFYFSSNGLTGMGGLDIFKTKNLGPADVSQYFNAPDVGTTVAADPSVLPDAVTDTSSSMKLEKAVDSLTYFSQLWKDPENLKYPLNSSADDFSIIFDENDVTESGYLSSTREGGVGSDDIWGFREPPLEFTIQGKVLDVDNRGGVKGATVELLGNDGSLVTVKSDKKGNYIFDRTMVKPKTVYKVTVQAKDYLSAKGIQSTVGLTQNTDLFQDAFLLKSTKRPIEMRNIFYDLNMATLRPESKISLDSLIEILNDNPKLVIRINSHTDSRSSDEYNMELSQRRAQSVVDYLVEHNIPQARLEAKGFGESKLKISDAEIAKAKTEPEKEALHQQNRRTEFEKLRDDYVPEDEINQDGSQEGGKKKQTIVSKPMISSKDSSFFGLKPEGKKATEAPKPVPTITPTKNTPSGGTPNRQSAQQIQRPASSEKPKAKNEDLPEEVPSPE